MKQIRLRLKISSLRKKLSQLDVDYYLKNTITSDEYFKDGHDIEEEIKELESKLKSYSFIKNLKLFTLSLIAYMCIRLVENLLGFEHSHSSYFVGIFTLLSITIIMDLLDNKQS